MNTIQPYSRARRKTSPVAARLVPTVRDVTPVSELHVKLRERKVLLGCSVESFSTTAAEMAGMLGFDIVWADLEHMGGSPREVELFCMAVTAGRAWPLVRVPRADRSPIMLTLEAGACLVSVPMVESLDTSRQIVEFGKFRPVGNRGFGGGTRGLRYGIGDMLANVEWANRETHLFVQIETVEALRRCREIVGVDGISGAVIGPADLSFSMGKPLQFDDPELVSAVRQAIREVRALDRLVIVPTNHPLLLDAVLEAGAQILICTPERGSLRAHWQQTLSTVKEKIR